MKYLIFSSIILLSFYFNWPQEELIPVEENLSNVIKTKQKIQTQPHFDINPTNQTKVSYIKQHIQDEELSEDQLIILTLKNNNLVNCQYIDNAMHLYLTLPNSNSVELLDGWIISVDDETYSLEMKGQCVDGYAFVELSHPSFYDIDYEENVEKPREIVNVGSNTQEQDYYFMEDEASHVGQFFEN